MKLGIVGLGIVGSAIKFGFEKIGHKVSIHDLKLSTKLEDVIDSEIIFLCLPTPSRSDGACDISILENVVSDICKLRKEMPFKTTDDLKVKLPRARQIIAIKSTIPPGTTEYFQNKYINPLNGLHICHNPEFLRERCAVTDFTENQDLCVIGTTSDWVFDKMVKAHGKLPKNIVQVTPKEAEMVKLFNNAFNACRITFANSFYEICQKLDVNYNNVKNSVVNIKHIPDYYLDVNENLRGFIGVCLPKDLKSLMFLVEENKIDVEFFKNIFNENNKYKATVIPGMRNE